MKTEKPKSLSEWENQQIKKLKSEANTFSILALVGLYLFLWMLTNNPVQAFAAFLCACLVGLAARRSNEVSQKVNGAGHERIAPNG